jgi:hypothetical protein
MVLLAGLGRCEHCGTVFSIENLPAEAMDAKWLCSNCEGELTDKSFGYEEVDGDWKKVKWVGPQGEWVSEKPTEDFELGRFFVIIRPIRPWYI